MLLSSVSSVIMGSNSNMDFETRVNNLTELVKRLTVTLNNSGILNNPRPSFNDKSLNVDVLDFEGTSGNPDDYINWENSLERYYEFKETPEDQRYKLAKVGQVGNHLVGGCANTKKKGGKV